jgi:predicted ArsR family transcriptional regulator
MDLFQYYPQAPGYRQRETSRAAAEHITPCAKTLRDKALQALSEPLTADEVAERLGVSILAIRPRVTELAKLGKVEDSGTRRKNSSGRPAIVWVVA